MKVEKFIRKSFVVDAVRVSAENLDDVATWCRGEVRSDESGPYIKVRVQAPLNERQTMAHVGDWVLYAGKGYKIYPDRAFRKSFVENGVPQTREENTKQSISNLGSTTIPQAGPVRGVVDKIEVNVPEGAQNVFEDERPKPGPHIGGGNFGAYNPGGTSTVP